MGLRRMYGIINALKTNQFPMYGEKLLARHGRNTLPVQDFPLGGGYFTADPRNVQAVLATNFKDWSMGSSRDFLHDFLGKGIFTQDGTEWHQSRALLRPSFTRTQIADFEVLEEHSEEMFQTINELKVNNIIDLKDLVSDLTLDFSAQFLFGKSADALKQRREGSGEKGLAFWFGRSLWYVTASFGFGGMHWLYRPREYLDGRKFVHNYIDKVVADALEAHDERLRSGEKQEKSGRYVFLTALTDEIQDPTALRAQVINIMLAGRDTTASLISWSIWVLARNPRVFRQLRSEIALHLGVGSKSRLPTWQELKDMKYLQAVIHESMSPFHVADWPSG